DIARALGNHYVTSAYQIFNYVWHTVYAFNENWFDSTARANAATQMTAVSTGDRFFTRAVNLEHHQRIDSGQYFNKIFVQIACARVAMRLINHHQTALGPTVTHSFNDRRDLTRMVAVVINQ